ESRILTIDASSVPAVVTDSTPIVGGTGEYDPEGIAVAPDGTYWIASEGDESDAPPNRLLQLDVHGHLLRELRLPEAIERCRAASSARDSLGSGFEGVAVVPRFNGSNLIVAQQRGWNYTTPECEALDDDPYDVDSEEPG